MPDFNATIAESSSDSDSASEDNSDGVASIAYGPTVPRSHSGSPSKVHNAPLDPQRPQIGMMFNSLEEAVHFGYEYERRRGYIWRKGESERNKLGKESNAVTMEHND